MAYWTECTTVWADDGGGGGGSGDTGSGDTGGGGGGGTGDPGDGWQDPCAGGGALPKGEGVQPCGDPGWLPVPPDDPSSYNPYEADDIILDTSLTNSFPCVKKIIDSLTGYSNVNALVQVALNTVFGLNEKIHLTFKSDPTLPYTTDGDTKPDSSYMVGSDFYATVRLNTWMLAHSTQEYIAATVIHEAVHAYIDFKYYQYITGIIDSTTFKTLFPLYWPPRFSNGYYLGPGNNSQHNIMAANLVSIMMEPLKSLYPNPNISTSLRDSIYNGITWGGLQNSQVFSTRADSLSIFAINLMARDTSIHAPFYLTQYPSTSYSFDSHNLKMKAGCQ